MLRRASIFGGNWWNGDNVSRARRKIAAWRRAGDTERLERFVPAWLGHARFADSHNLIRSLALEAA